MSSRSQASLLAAYCLDDRLHDAVTPSWQFLPWLLLPRASLLPSFLLLLHSSSLLPFSPSFLHSLPFFLTSFPSSSYFLPFVPPFSLPIYDIPFPVCFCTPTFPSCLLRCLTLLSLHFLTIRRPVSCSCVPGSDCVLPKEEFFDLQRPPTKDGSSRAGFYMCQLHFTNSSNSQPYVIEVRRAGTSFSPSFSFFFSLLFFKSKSSVFRRESFSQCLQLRSSSFSGENRAPRRSQLHPARLPGLHPRSQRSAGRGGASPDLQVRFSKSARDCGKAVGRGFCVVSSLNKESGRDKGSLSVVGGF